MAGYWESLWWSKEAKESVSLEDLHLLKREEDTCLWISWITSYIQSVLHQSWKVELSPLKSSFTSGGKDLFKKISSAPLLWGCTTWQIDYVQYLRDFLTLHVSSHKGHNVRASHSFRGITNVSLCPLLRTCCPTWLCVFPKSHFMKMIFIKIERSGATHMGT